MGQYRDSSAAAAAEPKMDGVKWCKYCKDTGMIDKQVTTTDVDLIFAKVRV